MSSHHFVVEGQEPALIIANGERCGTSLMDQLLEWSPFTLVVDGALQDILDKKIAFNAISGDFDSEPNAAKKTKHLEHVEVFETPNQDKTDLEKAIEICINKGFKDVHIIWGTGKRMDHSISNLNLITHFKNKVNLVFWDDYQKIYNAHNGFSKWFKKGTDISLIPWPTCELVNAENLDWPLKDLDLKLPEQLSTSNRIKEDGILKIQYSSGNLLIAESLNFS